jgi:hypothetical protein
MNDIASIQTDYQILLEKHRLDPDDEETWRLFCQTREQLEIAWLTRSMGSVV